MLSVSLLLAVTRVLASWPLWNAWLSSVDVFRISILSSLILYFHHPLITLRPLNSALMIA
jgi:hypothetical protein